MYYLEVEEQRYVETEEEPYSENEPMLYYSETQSFIGNERFSTPSGQNQGLNEYFMRIFHFSQMDFQWALYQMIKLCTEPSVVTKYTKHRKQRKNQWARDDPAFLVILVCFMVVSSTAYSVAFGSSLSQWFGGLIKSVFIDFLLVGIIFSTINWFIANNYLRVVRMHAVEQRTEWLYSFDVHCNGYVPYFFISHVLMFFLTPIILKETTITLLLANTMYTISLCAYFYITFQGYHALPFLHHTKSFLYPIGLLLLLYILSLLSHKNIVRIVLNFYYDS